MSAPGADRFQVSRSTFHVVAAHRAATFQPLLVTAHSLRDSGQSILMKRTVYFLLAVVAVVACVIIPYITWQETWFGRPLTDAELTDYLQDPENSRHIQHALTQIAERMDRGESADRWYEDLIQLSEHPMAPVRVTAAWVMGQDPAFKSFHQALTGLLQDDELLVRRNAALSLVRFADTAGLSELRDMLVPHTVRAPVEGAVDYLVSEGEEVHSGTLLVRLNRRGEIHEVRSPLSSSIQSVPLLRGTEVKTGTELLMLSPDANHVWESLRALALVGGVGDLDLVLSIEGDPGFNPEVRSQAILTREAIEKRLGEETPDR